MIFNNEYLDKKPKFQNQHPLFDLVNGAAYVVVAIFLMAYIVYRITKNSVPQVESLLTNYSYGLYSAILILVISHLISTILRKLEIKHYKSFNADEKLEFFKNESVNVKKLVANDIKENGYFSAYGYWLAMDIINIDDAEKLSNEEINLNNKLSEKYPDYFNKVDQ